MLNLHANANIQLGAIMIIQYFVKILPLKISDLTMGRI